MLILFDVPKEIVGNLNVENGPANVSEETLIEVVKYIDNGVIIQDGATNGDIIKAMFPNVKTWVVNKDMAVEFPKMLTIRLFPLVWWNALYKEQTNE